MTMLSADSQQRVREALQRIDKAVAAEVAQEEALHQRAVAFRDTFFGAFQFIERESLQLREILVQIQRPDSHQLQIQSRRRGAFVVQFDPEFAYDTRPGSSADAPPTQELAARIFAVLAPPLQGLLRYYTVFADGTWKRTTFLLSAEGPRPRTTLVPQFSAEVLTLEAADLLGYASTLHATWAALTDEAETLTLELARTRTVVKHHLTGLGAPRRRAAP